MYGDYSKVDICKNGDGTIVIEEIDPEGNTRTYSPDDFGSNVAARLIELGLLLSINKCRSVLDLIFDDDLIVGFDVQEVCDHD